MQLVLPVAGRSSRFPGMRPKWLLTLPNGSLMYEESVASLDMSQFSEISLVCLKEHISQHTSEEALTSRFKKKFGRELKLVILEEPTSSASETICKAIQQSPTGPFVVKDCDNAFAVNNSCKLTGNFVGYVDLNKVDLVDAKNKSYVEIGERGNIVNIIEKVVISDKFCCGLYGFSDAKDFLNAFEDLSSIAHSEIYVSHVIHCMLLNGFTFSPVECVKYTDWGTLREYNHFRQKYKTLFLDFDGVCVENSSAFAKEPWTYIPLEKNMRHLRKIYETGMVQIVVTTARPEEQRENIDNYFKKYGINLVGLVCGLNHASRILINDFSSTNIYPTASSINVKRDADDLSLFL